MQGDEQATLVRGRQLAGRGEGRAERRQMPVSRTLVRLLPNGGILRSQNENSRRIARMGIPQTVWQRWNTVR